VIAALSVLLTAASTSDAHGHHNAVPKCSPEGSEPVAADVQAEVYAVTHKFQGHSRVSFAGCIYGSSRLYQLGHAIEGGSIDSRVFALAGPIVAYTTLAPANASVPETLKVIVLNLSTGQMLHHESFPPISEATSIVVKSDGSAAWIAAGPTYDCVPIATPCYEVEDVEEEGGGALLAKGAEIEPYSLALSGNIIYWTQDSKPGSAILDCSPAQICPLILSSGS
jgi:hypothetical protein